MPKTATLPAYDASDRYAVIVGVQIPGDDSDFFDDDLSELKKLLTTLGIEVRGSVVQRRQKPTAKCLIGSGKAIEIKELAEFVGAGLIVVDRPLSPPQARNLEEMTGRRVLDRTGVILEIFAKHARTNEAKTQVEIAKLEYLLPRLSGAWTHFQRQTGGVNARGMGEKQIEIDRRRARERISRLQKQLGQIQKERLVQRRSRRGELKIALVGYTNSGKTTLMNALTRAQLLAQDALFATLDANVRMLNPQTRPRILVSDTVGFIRNLPHALVASFKSTLDEVLEADLLLHVVDMSHPNFREQMSTTEAVLEEIGAGSIPTIMVFNKADMVDDVFLPRVLRKGHSGSICLSAHDEADVKRLREHIYRVFETVPKNALVRARLAVPHDDQVTLSQIYRSCLVIQADYTDPGATIFEVQTAQTTLARLRAFVRDDAN